MMAPAAKSARPTFAWHKPVLPRGLLAERPRRQHRAAEQRPEAAAALAYQAADSVHPSRPLQHQPQQIRSAWPPAPDFWIGLSGSPTISPRGRLRPSMTRKRSPTCGLASISLRAGYELSKANLAARRPDRQRLRDQQALRVSMRPPLPRRRPALVRRAERRH